MLKNPSSLALALALIVSLSFTSGAFALNYSNRQGNKATFETLEETRVSSPAAAASRGAAKNIYKSHPVLDGYPKGTTYVYRSANLWGGRANRSNTNILVFAGKSFQDKNAALAYLKDLGLINIIDTAIGSVVLITPSDPKAGFAAADQKHYYALQTAMLSLGASERSNNAVTTFSDGDYFGGFGFLYVIGIDGGATFFNNYIASTFDYASRIAGAMFTFKDKMDAQFKETDLPFMYLTSAYDLQPNINPEDGSLSDNSQVLLNKFLLFNNMNPVSYDFTAHPKCGFQADAWSETLLNDEHENYIWYLNNKQGVPMVALNYTANLIHALYPQYAGMAWDYLIQFSRDQKTGVIQHNPNAK